MSKIAAERRSEIVDILLQEGSIRVADMAKTFGVTTETIRKDLAYLEKENILQKSHGGAVISGETLVHHIAPRSAENTEAKKKIAVKAVEQICPKDVVLLDSGSTTALIARQLLSMNGLTVITNSLLAANILAESDHNIHIVGGKMYGNTLSLCGLWAQQALESIRPDIAFIGSNGFAGFHGPTSERFEEAQFKQMVTRICSKTVVVADSSKFVSKGVLSFADWKDINLLITDSDAGRYEDVLREIKGSTQTILV